MFTSFFDYLKETFENLDNLNREKVQELSLESHLFFNSLGEIIQSGDQRARDQIFLLLLELKRFLDAKAYQIGSFTDVLLSEEEEGLLEEMEEALNGAEKTKVKKQKKIKPKNMS